MKRSQLILAGLGGVLDIALFFVLLFQPAREEVAALEVQIADEQQMQITLEQEIARLRLVRDEAPSVEADLATAEAIVPRDASLPSALRQLQLAADESGVVLQSVATARPVAVEGPPDGLSSIGVDLQLVGGYFQTVDFLRRIEDPSITPRGLAWNNVSLARDEYPALAVLLSGSFFATIPPAVPAEVPEPQGDDAGTGDEADVGEPTGEADEEEAS